MVPDFLTEGAGRPAAPQPSRPRSLALAARLSLSSGRDAILRRARDADRALWAFRRTAAADPDCAALRRRCRRADPGPAPDRPRRLQPTTRPKSRWSAGTRRPFPATPMAGRSTARRHRSARLTRDDLKAQHARLFAKDVLKVVIVGDIDKAGGRRGDRRDLRRPSRARQKSTCSERSSHARCRHRWSSPRTSRWPRPPSGCLRLPSDHPDFPALQVLNHVIGSGDFDSRLMEEMRVKRGLAYSIQTGLLYDSISSLLLGGFATKNENMGTALWPSSAMCSRARRATARRRPSSTTPSAISPAPSCSTSTPTPKWRTRC